MSYRLKQAQASYEAYRNSKMSDLSDAYKDWSTEKARAWRYCEELCEKRNGFGLKVISKNSYMFTAGFEYVDEDGCVRFEYITPSYDIDIDCPF